MKYYRLFDALPFTGKELRNASKILKQTFPDGPKIYNTVKPDKKYSFNEIASNIRPSLIELSKSLY